MNEKLDRRPVCDRRYYGVFAVNKKNPDDILGYVEHSFCMGWSRKFVRLEEGLSRRAVEKMTDDWTSSVDEYNDSGKDFAKYLKRIYPELYRDGMTSVVARAVYRKHIYEMFERGHLSQNVWNDMLSKVRVPAGYELKKFRLGSSKNCPVDVDFRYRTAVMRRTAPRQDKWKYRNAPFVLKKNGVGITDIYKTVESVLDDPDKGCVEFAKYVVKADSTRSDRQLLKKQRINSFAAMERAKGG